MDEIKSLEERLLKTKLLEELLSPDYVIGEVATVYRFILREIKRKDAFDPVWKEVAGRTKPLTYVDLAADTNPQSMKY
jgi:hypothetical protein